MPKRATHTFESSKDGLQDDSLFVYYCLYTGEQALVLDKDLTSLPKRKTDGAFVLRRETEFFKLNAERGKTVLIKRSGGFERQYRMNCSGSGLPIAYATSEAAEPDLVYIMPNAVGTHPEMYMKQFKVPPCIQMTPGGQVRVALEVESSSPRRAVTDINDGAVVMTVKSHPRDGQSNADVLEFMVQTLNCKRSQIKLTRGWSHSSKFLMVTGTNIETVHRSLMAVLSAKDKEDTLLKDNEEVLGLGRNGVVGMHQ